MIAGLSFFDLGLIAGLLAVVFFCVWAFVRTLKQEFRARPFEDYELREFEAHVQAKKQARASREVRL